MQLIVTANLHLHHAFCPIHIHHAFSIFKTSVNLKGNKEEAAILISSSLQYFTAKNLYGNQVGSLHFITDAKLGAFQVSLEE